MRGKEKVSGEMSLTVLAYNIKRVVNIIGLEKLKEAVLMIGELRETICSSVSDAFVNICRFFLGKLYYLKNYEFTFHTI